MALEEDTGRKTLDGRLWMEDSGWKTLDGSGQGRHLMEVVREDTGGRHWRKPLDGRLWMEDTGWKTLEDDTGWLGKTRDVDGTGN